MTTLSEPRIETKDQVAAEKVSARTPIPINEELKNMHVDLKVEVLRFNKDTNSHEEPETIFDTKALCIDDLLTNGGRDLIHNAAFMTGTQPAALTYYAVTSTSGFSPAAGNTTLTGEITSPSQMARHKPTGTIDGVVESFTHTASTNTTVVVCAFKNNGATVISAYGYGNFNAASNGTLGTTSAFTGVTLQVNDILKLTVTITAG